jgi:hypothetical protein
VVLADPELLEPETIELSGELEVATELQCRMFAERMVRSEESAELEMHPGKLLVQCGFDG